MHISEIYQIYLSYPKISTDTRKIEKDSIFFALKGDNFNGNTFAEQALEAGAAYVIIDEGEKKKGDRYILVDNVLITLQQLAVYHRDQLKIPIIGITGTNGKTTTKELIHAVLNTRFKTFATQGNLNNHIGVPLSILSVTTETEVAIIEMGANHQKEIAFLCRIAKPNYGLITNVGRAHLEGFGDFNGVKKTKAELYEWLAENNGILFLQKDNSELVEMAAPFKFKKIINYGFNDNNDVYGNLVANNPLLSLEWNYQDVHSTIQTQLTGAYNTENILAAIAIGCYLGLSQDEINKGVGNYQPKNNRSQILETGKNTVICDYYNANASSMKAAIENLQAIKSDYQKVLILGDMFELGGESAKEHEKIVNKALLLTSVECIFVGKEFYRFLNPRAHFFETTEATIAFLTENPLNNRLILLKASRGMAFERLISLL